MCGFAGFAEFNHAALISKGSPLEVIREMMDTIIHRGPDDYGISVYGYGEDRTVDKHVSLYKSDVCKAAFGLRRLSILDLSENGRQPMKSKDGEIEIIFNGEIYNYIELRDRLKDKVSFMTGTDTEVLIEAYLEWDTEMLNMLDGMFSFVIMDKRKQKFICARDPIGIKPFYFNHSKDFFVFGSEPKVVLKGLGTNGSADITRASEFFMIGVTDHDEGTFYNEVKQLSGGHWMEVSFNGSASQPKQYWHAPVPYLPSSGDYSEPIFQNILLSVKRQLRADVSIGTSLSGGIDSGAIVTAAGEILGKNSNYNTLTFSYPGFENDESEFAKIIADNSGMKWHPVTPDTQALGSDLEKMMKGMGEPFSTLSMFAQFKVMEEAHRLGIKVMLDGQGGDEIYLGYPRVAQRILIEKLKKVKIAGFVNELRGLRSNASLPLSRSLLGNVFFTSPSVALKRNRGRLMNYVNGEMLESFRKDIAEDVYSSKDIFKTQVDELTKYCLPRLLKYSDRNSMVFSVESRVPHLSKIMLDYALRLPLNWRVRDGWTKYSVRKAMQGRLPDKILWSNKKQGFPIPQKYWVEKLRNNIQDWISLDSLNGFIKKDNIMKAIDQGKGNEQHLWRAISFASWVNFMGVKI